MSIPFDYVATDVQPGLTLRAWRRNRRAVAVPISSRWRRLARRLLGHGRPPRLPALRRP